MTNLVRRGIHQKSCFPVAFKDPHTVFLVEVRVFRVMRVCKVARHSEALAVTFMVFLKALSGSPWEGSDGFWLSETVFRS